MAIIHIDKHDNPYVMIDKKCLEDSHLSWKARGILAYLLSKPKDWEVLTCDLVAKSDNEGRAAIRSAMRELVACGYAALQPIQGEDGRMHGKRYTVSETCRDSLANPLGIPA